jgi:purine-nucleoside phosphorylase
MNLKETIQYIESKVGVKHPAEMPKTGFILGSGLGEFADQLTSKKIIPFKDIPHFKKPNVVGHSGEIVFGKIGNIPVVAMKGRIHFYEGHSVEEVVYPVRTLGQLGIETLVVTNSSGGLKPTMKPGEFMVIEDHINLTGQNPLIGRNDDSLGPRFPDMSEAYDKKLSQKMLAVLKKIKVKHSKGVYCGVLGPCYETPAEVKFLQKIGGGAVGMSTVLEVIAAKHMGLKVVGLSCITNSAAGILDKPLNHKEVTDAAQKATKDFIKALTEFTKSL